MGNLAIQIAKARGMRVLATVSGDAKAKIAREAGADVVINYRTEDVGTRVKATTEVTAWRAPKLLALETRLDGLMLLDRATLEPTSEGKALVETLGTIAR